MAVHCSTCGKDSETSECAVCAQWWKDNVPKESRHLTEAEQRIMSRALRKSVKIVHKAKK